MGAPGFVELKGISGGNLILPTPSSSGQGVAFLPFVLARHFTFRWDYLDFELSLSALENETLSVRGTGGVTLPTQVRFWLTCPSSPDVLSVGAALTGGWY